MTAPREDGEGPMLAMKHALRHAGISPAAVDYINAHATSTVLGDAAENRAVKKLLLSENGKSKASEINVSSSKGAIGHLLGAAGSVEAIFTILALHQVSLLLYSSFHQAQVIIEYSPTDFESCKPWRSTRRVQLQLCTQHCSREAG